MQPERQQSYFFPLLAAIILHTVVLGFIFYAFTFNSELELTAPLVSPNPQPTPNIVRAVSVNQAAVEQEVAKIQQQQQAAEKAEQLKQQKLAEQRAALQQEQARTAKAIAALKNAQQNQSTELNKLKEQRQLLAKQQAEQDLQRKLAAQQQQLAADQAKQAADAAKAKQVASELDKYKQLILTAIYPNWIVSQKDRNLSTDLIITVAATGAVLNVTVDRSSGSDAFDRSAIAAVYKSSPLPVPKDPSLFAMFKQFKLTLQPENIVASV